MYSRSPSSKPGKVLETPLPAFSGVLRSEMKGGNPRVAFLIASGVIEAFSQLDPDEVKMLTLLNNLSQT